MVAMTLSKPKVRDVYNILSTYDFQNIEEYLENREGYEKEEIKEMKEEYIRFISICSEHATNDKPVVISSQVDPFWHTHILFTKDYRAMCKKIFGKDSYLNHEPTKTNEDILTLDKAYNDGSLALYSSYFGKPNEKYWPKNAMICGGSNCSCSGTGND